MVAPNTPAGGAGALVCARVADVPAGAAIPAGVRAVTCAGCGTPVYASAASRELVAAGVARFVCKLCVGPGPFVPVVTGPQAAELLSFLREGRP